MGILMIMYKRRQDIWIIWSFARFCNDYTRHMHKHML
jgi:hypothetical protein